MKRTRFITRSDAETKQRGELLAKTLHGGAIVALYGELGAGKTTFVQGLANGLGIKKRIISPTFIIVRTYKMGIRNFYHIDLYRVETQQGVEGLGLDEILSDKDSIVAIEWAEKLGSLLPKKRIDINFEYLSDDKRRITFNE